MRLKLNLQYIVLQYNNVFITKQRKFALPLITFFLKKVVDKTDMFMVKEIIRQKEHCT